MAPLKKAMGSALVRYESIIEAKIIGGLMWRYAPTPELTVSGWRDVRQLTSKLKPIATEAGALSHFKSLPVAVRVVSLIVGGYLALGRRPTGILGSRAIFDMASLTAAVLSFAASGTPARTAA